MQERIYFIGRRSREIKTLEQMQELGFPTNWQMIPVHVVRASPLLSTEVFYRKCFVAPADWFPGICDAWVQAHAADVELEKNHIRP